MLKLKSIYQYFDYRLALKDFYARSKAQSAQFSFSTFSKKAGLSSPNYLKLVMDGDRRLTTANIQLFAKAMDLGGEEIEYFEAIVLENQAESPVEKRYYASRVKRLRRGAAKGSVSRRPSSLIESSLQTALFLCAIGKTREEAVHFSVEELGIPEEKATAILDSLLKHQELHQDSESGLFKAMDRHTLMHDPKGLSERQARFLKGGLEEAQLVFNARYPNGAAKFLSLLVTAPEHSLQNVFSDLKTAVQGVAEKYEPVPGEAAGVYRFQFQVYRMRKDEA